LRGTILKTIAMELPFMFYFKEEYLARDIAIFVFRLLILKDIYIYIYIYYKKLKNFTNLKNRYTKIEISEKVKTLR